MAQKRVAIVTGAGSGIGKSAALALLKDGYYVGLVGRRKDMLEKTAAESGAKDRALVLAADITKDAEVKKRFQRGEDQMGPPRRPVQQRRHGRARGADGRPADREIPRGGRTSTWSRCSCARRRRSAS